MNPIQLLDAASGTCTYLLFDVHTREALIIDPVHAQIERDVAFLRNHGLQLVWAVETHLHADHTTGAGHLAERTGARTAAPAGCHIGTAAVQLQHGDTLRFGQETLHVLHAPGHPAGRMSCLWRGHVFTGDALLIDGCGRTDFPSGHARDLHRSLAQELSALPDATCVWPGHHTSGRTHSTIGLEKAQNPHIAGKTEDAFVALMVSLKPPGPHPIGEAVPVHVASGPRHGADGAPQPQPQPGQGGYAGDVSPQLAWQWVQEGQAVLVDVRTDAEREWVGFVPGAIGVAWKQWPGMVPNPAFDHGIREAAATGQPLVLLCRSGVRSVAAARRATELGLTAYNILEGFEGDPDHQAQRGRTGGWRFHGLPWRQN